MRTDTRSRPLVNTKHRAKRGGFKRGTKKASVPPTLGRAIPPKLLCIDDDPEVTRTIELRMQPYDVTMVRALYGMQGFWLAMTEKPQVIVTDIRMPQGQGDFLIQCLKANAETRSIPVIVLTGVRDPAFQKRMYHLGADAYLEKPCPFEQMLDTLRGFMDIREFQSGESRHE